GQLHSSKVGWPTIARNVVLMAIAGFLVAQGPNQRGLPDMPSALTSSEVTILVLVLVVVAQAIIGVIVLYHVLRQNGRILNRLDAIEAKLGSVPVHERQPGLPVQSQAPLFELQAVHNAKVSLNMLRGIGKPILLFFSEPGCAACDAILPEIGLWQREHDELLLI